MSVRTEQLRDTLLAIEPELCPERASLLTAAWRETDGVPTVIRRALAFARVLGGMSIYIRPGELLVGNQARQPRAAPIFPEYAVRWVEAELDTFASRPFDRFQVAADARATLSEVCRYWQGRTFQDRVVAATRLALPEEVRPAFDLRLFSFNEALTNLSHTSTGDGHVVAGYETAITTGFQALIDDARAHLRALDPARPESVDKSLFYQAVIVVLEAAIAFAGRYADLAEAQAAAEADPVRRAELEQIAATCRWVPSRPARTFQEALQAYWFAHLLIQIEANGHSISPGRFDQYVYPYYAADLAAGRLAREQALELVECFWLKCMELNKVREWAYTHYMSGYPTFQTVTLGGQTPEGRDASNEVTYLCLEATGNLKLPQPTAVLRVHDGSPDELLLAAARCLLRHGGGMPGFFNDEVGVPLLLRLGIPLAEARDWSVMGCSEPQVAGKFNTGTGGTCQVNLLKVLEIALHGGANPNTGLRPLPETKDLRTFADFSELFSAFRRQLAYYLSLIPLLDNVTSQAYADLTPTPFLSALIDGRLAAGRDVSLGGPPNYNNIVQHAYGTANVANSLAALKKLVYEEKRLSGADLAEVLAADFAGPRGEEARQLLLNRAPKFGNDDEGVDLLAREVVNLLVAELERYVPARGGTWGPSTQSLTANVPQGAKVGATPDGRRAGEPLADNNSPTPGSDANGPTAVLKSVARLDHTLISNGTILNLKFHPSALRGEERLRKFTALIRTFFDLKGFQVQFNVTSAEVLRAAQAHPEEYRNLVVKVAGYSALFCTLDRKLQDQIIARTTNYLA
ncbi:MAG: glycyl radical protein [Chloroflexi bacterium]|nr:glycyl radical protein [Chloroflexota bacterium]